MYMYIHVYVYIYIRTYVRTYINSQRINNLPKTPWGLPKVVPHLPNAEYLTI